MKEKKLKPAILITEDGNLYIEYSKKDDIFVGIEIQPKDIVWAIIDFKTDKYCHGKENIEKVIKRRNKC